MNHTTVEVTTNLASYWGSALVEDDGIFGRTRHYVTPSSAAWDKGYGDTACGASVVRAQVTAYNARGKKMCPKCADSYTRDLLRDLL